MLEDAAAHKRRREEGRTADDKSQATGNPNRPLEERTADELRNIGSEMKIKGRSKMKKNDLVKAIRARRG